MFGAETLSGLKAPTLDRVGAFRVLRWYDEGPRQEAPPLSRFLRTQKRFLEWLPRKPSVSKPRIFVGLTTREYADAHGISLRSAQRRVANIPGATRSAKGWRIPLPAVDYARKMKGKPGYSASTLRKKGFHAVDIAEEMKKRYPGTLRQQAAEHRAQLVAGKPNADGPAMIRRIERANPRQLRRMLGTQRESDFDYKAPEWEDEDGESVVYYHSGK